MARLAAIQKMLYYPTPDRVMDMIASAVVWGHNPLQTEQGRILDPCAGEGAVAVLGKAWGLPTLGIELDPNRADTASVVLDEVRCGSYSQLKVKQEQTRVPPICSVLFLNPPYDDDRSGEYKRQEIQFLTECTPFLCDGGVLIFIPPRHILSRDDFQIYLRNHYKNVKIYSFPEPEVHAFDQVVVFAQKGNSYNYYRSYGPLEIDGVLSEETRYSKPEYGADLTKGSWSKFGTYRFDPINPFEYAPEAHEGVYATEAWQRLMGERPTFEDAPLCTPRPGHRAMLLAAGAIDGVDVGGTLIKGSSEKQVSITVEETFDKEGDPKEIEVHRQKLVTRISTLDLFDGSYESWTANEDQSRTAEWFHDHAEVLSQAIAQRGAPKFKPEDLDKFDFTPFRAPGILPGHTEPMLLPLQKQGAASMVTLWRSGWKVGLVCGEQGVGKTTIGTLSVGLYGAKKTIIICPSHLTRKWVRETSVITGKKCAMVGKKLSDVDKFFADPSMRFLVLSKEMAKLGSRWEQKVTERNLYERYEYKSPGYYDYYNNCWVPGETHVSYSRNKVRACPSCGTTVHLEKASAKTKQKCEKCKDQLWQTMPLTAKGTKRFPLGRYIAKKYPHQYLAIIDECHQNSGESDQAAAAHAVISKAKKALLMTGTIYSGRASSIFQLLYWMDPRFRQVYKQNDAALFVEHHGLFEERREVEEKTTTYGYRRGGKASKGRIKEIPGMSPAMIPMMLTYANFIKLKDLELNLPGYVEEVRVVDHDKEVLASVLQMQDQLKMVLRKHPKVLGAYLQACLGYPDCPEQEEAIYARDDDGNLTDELLASAPAYPKMATPKDREVLRICEEARAEGRKVLVYCTQTHRRDARHRLASLLGEAGFRVEILEADISPDRREEWVQERADHLDVLITNGRLVETGLDLVFASVVVQYGIEYSIHSLRQSIRRCWRLGQTQDVKVYFLGYRNTMQEVALNLIARKMRAAEMVDGDDTGGLANYDEGGNDFLYDLAREVVNS